MSRASSPVPQQRLSWLLSPAPFATSELAAALSGLASEADPECARRRRHEALHRLDVLVADGALSRSRAAAAGELMLDCGPRSEPRQRGLVPF